MIQFVIISVGVIFVLVALMNTTFEPKPEKTEGRTLRGNRWRIIKPGWRILFISKTFMGENYDKYILQEKRGIYWHDVYSHYRNPYLTYDENIKLLLDMKGYEDSKKSERLKDIKNPF